jgi:hypothetical protein
LTEPGERIAAIQQETLHYTSFARDGIKSWHPYFEVGEIVEQQSGVKHSDLTIEVRWMQDYLYGSLTMYCRDRGMQSAGGSLMRLTEQLDDAPLVHLNGPLTMRLNMRNGRTSIPIDYANHTEEERRRWYVDNPPVYDEDPLVAGQAVSICAELGTPGLGADTFATSKPGLMPNPALVELPKMANAVADRPATAVSRECQSIYLASAGAVPESLHPVAEIEYIVDGRKSPVKSRVVLKDRCCGGTFTAKTTAPRDAAPGEAIVKLSFGDWREGRVTPAAGVAKVIHKVEPAQQNAKE